MKRRLPRSCARSLRISKVELRLNQEKLVGLEPWLESEPGKAAEVMKGDLRFYRNMTYVGWTFSVLLGLAFAASLLSAETASERSAW